jgi:hypothetical protein
MRRHRHEDRLLSFRRSQTWQIVPGQGLADDAAPRHLDLFTARIFRVRTTNHGQLEQTLRELRRRGRIEKIHAAAVQALKSMAVALDADPGNAALWRQYREALRELTADDDAGSLGDALDDLFAEVRDEAPS